MRRVEASPPLIAVMEWQREQEFMKTLSGAVKKPSKGAVSRLVQIAVEDEAQARPDRGQNRNHCWLLRDLA